MSADKNPAADSGAVFLCSSRAGGNSEAAASIFSESLLQSGLDTHSIALRDYTVNPCMACYKCARDPEGRCFLEDTDQSAKLFRILLQAPFTAFFSPIYFYHLPGIFKVFIDRAQSHYIRKEQQHPEMTSLPRRQAYIVLVAGRKSGEKLFDGSLTTLKYFLDPFNVVPAEPLLLRGLDGPDDLRNSPEAVKQVQEYARKAARENRPEA